MPSKPKISKPEKIITVPDDLNETDVLALAVGNLPNIPLGANHPFTLTTPPMDEEWRERFDEAQKQITISDPVFRGKRQNLIDGLIAMGGMRALISDVEPDIDSLLSHGRLFEGASAKIVAGRPNSCHSNASALWAKDHKTKILMTGYALSEDALWREHSWVLDVGPTTREIIETTEPRVAYFGFAMTKLEALFFFKLNGR